MTDRLRIELTCPPQQRQLWIDWLLQHHQGTFDIQTLHRYGLAEAQLTPGEQVKGCAERLRFTFDISQGDWQQLQKLCPALPDSEWRQLA